VVHVARSTAQVVQFNCNFCALSGPFPDMFNDMPSLQITYWSVPVPRSADVVLPWC